MRKKVFIVNDVECSGQIIGVHGVLSWGACVVTPDSLTRNERIERGLTFYAEFQPLTKHYSIDAMRVGSVGLRCIGAFKGLSAYDVASEEFNPERVLEALRDFGESVYAGTRRFKDWLKSVAGTDEVVGVTDTVFFDAGFINYLFGFVGEHSPYGHKGIDLDSLCRGYARNMNCGLRWLSVPDARETPHCALDDAMHLANIASRLIYREIEYKER